MKPEWILTSGESILMVVVSAIGIYLSLVLFTRMAGLRSFSKMSSFDFAVTVAFGSLLASTVLTDDPPLMQSVAALAVLFLIQYGVSKIRLRSETVVDLVDNDPLLIMAGPEILYDNLRKARMTEDDLFSKLREANICRFEEIRAVIAESTGDVSVLHAAPDAPPLEIRLLHGVRDAERIEQYRR